MNERVRDRKVENRESWMWSIVMESGAEYGLDCDADGYLRSDGWYSEHLRQRQEVYAEAVTSGAEMVMQCWTERVVTPAAIRCRCGREVELWSGWANECECGREYNGSGQELAPRSQWGEETGEDPVTLSQYSSDEYGRVDFGRDPEEVG